MDAILRKCFWVDEGVIMLPKDLKFAAAYLITGPHRDICGFTRIPAPLFACHTGLEVSVLAELCEALPKSFEGLGKDVWFVRNFLRWQFGRGGRFSLSNNIVKSAINHIERAPEALQKPFFEAYPEIPSAAPPAASPSQGHRKGEEKEKEEGGVGGDPADLCEQIRQAYPRRTHVRETLTSIQAAILRNAGQYSAEAILAGTKAIAEAVRQWPEDEQRKIPRPPAFFEGDRWRDDPADWVSWKAERVAQAQAQRPHIGRPEGGRTRIPS